MIELYGIIATALYFFIGVGVGRLWCGVVEDNLSAGHVFLWPILVFIAAVKS